MATPNLTSLTNVAPKIMASLQLAVGDNAIYTVPGGHAAKLTKMILCNVSGAAVNVAVSIIPSAGVVDGTHKILSTYPIPANDSLTVDEVGDMWLAEGDKVSVNSGTTAAIDATLTGLEFS